MGLIWIVGNVCDFDTLKLLNLDFVGDCFYGKIHRRHVFGNDWRIWKEKRHDHCRIWRNHKGKFSPHRWKIVLIYINRYLRLIISSENLCMALLIAIPKSDIGNRTAHVGIGEDKYALELLNYSTELGYEGLFAKFKVALTETQKEIFLGALGRVERIYKVTEFELSAKESGVQNYPCATTYTYKGYAQGYGSPFSDNESTLTCAVDGFEEYVELDVHQTVYRPKGDLSIQTEEGAGIYSQGQLKDGNQVQLNSCYFRVPKKYFTQYGELTKALCQWYEYMTKPILVTTDLNAWRSLQAIQGSPTTDYYPNRDNGVMVMSFGNQYYTNSHVFNPDWHVTPFMWTSNVEKFDEKNYYKYYADDVYGLHWPGGDISVEDWLKQRFNNLAAIFYKSGVSYWNATVSAQEIKQQLLDNSARLGGPFYNGADGYYSQALFTDYVDAGRIRGYNKKEIQLQKNETAIWSNATEKKTTIGYGNELLEIPESFTYQQGVTIKESDLVDNDETIANKLYFAKDDVADLKAEYQKAVAHDEELVLLRYALTNYHSGKAIVKIQDISDEKENGRDEKLMHEWMDEYHHGNVNGYLAQETIFLNFDVISLWFATDDADTEIPVMMTPMDVINGLQPGVAEKPDSIGSSSMPWWFWLILVLVLIVIIIVLTLFFPILKPIVAAILKVLWWIITAPFRFIAWIVKKISEAVKKKKEAKAAAPPELPEPKGTTAKATTKKSTTKKTGTNAKKKKP